ncbi:hypothetical protein [Asaia sp. VD9]|uniref:hypothetical protein n=1 Tax=Asaia sp. VD9 TaxID=3081235 RepID=UPI003016DECB
MKGPTAAVSRGVVLGLQAIAALCGALSPHEANLSALTLDPLNACWLLLWTVSRIPHAARQDALTEALGGLGLLCDSTTLALLCFLPCLAQTHRQIPDADVAPPRSAWRLGLLAPASCLLALLPFVPALAFLAPLAGLGLLPAFAELPLLAYALLVPALLDTTSLFWPLCLILVGGGLCLTMPVGKGLAGFPLLLLGLTMCARIGNLPDTAMAGAEATILALALTGLGKTGFLFRTPLPPLAGFLPFWLALHVIDALCGLSPAWTAGGVMLSLVIGVLMIRSWLAAWQQAARSPPSLSQTSLAPVTLGLVLSICPGLFLGLVHKALLVMAGSSGDTWRGWPLWSLAGGDGAFWYPALIFLIPALVAPLLIGPLLPTRTGIPPWPIPEFRLRLPWTIKRFIVTGVQRFGALVTFLHGARDMGQMNGRSTRAFETPLIRQALPLWLAVLAVALAWLGWTA